MREEIARIEREYEGRSDYAKGLAMGPAMASLDAIDGRYGGDLDGRSHGQSFLTLFQARFIPGGLHLIDERKRAAIPQSQLALMTLMHEMIGQGGHVVIATARRRSSSPSPVRRSTRSTGRPRAGRV